MSDFRPDVVAGKYDPALFDPTGGHLLVNEVFYSLQGEGRNTGKATVFVRLAKCNLACKFCDTEFERGERVDVLSLFARVQSAMRAGGLDSCGDSNGAPLIDITGGEPLLQNLMPFVEVCKAHGYEVGIETSGSIAPPLELRQALDHVTVSPKLAKDRVPWAALYPTEVKWVVNATFLAMHERAPDSVYFPGLDTRVLVHKPGCPEIFAQFGDKDCKCKAKARAEATILRLGDCPNFLQPESNQPKMMQAARKLILAQPGRYRLSLQTHKVGGWE